MPLSARRRGRRRERALAVLAVVALAGGLAFLFVERDAIRVRRHFAALADSARRYLELEPAGPWEEGVGHSDDVARAEEWVLSRPDVTTFRHGRVGGDLLHGNGAPENLAMEAARARLKRDREDAAARVRRWTLTGAERAAHDLLLARASCLPDRAELAEGSPAGAASLGERLWIVFEGGEDVRVARGPWPWLEAFYAAVRGLAQPLERASEDASDEDLAGFLLRVARLAPESPALVHAVLALAFLDDAPPSAEREAVWSDARAELGRLLERSSTACARQNRGSGSSASSPG
jgi:hypothetical protein